MNELKCWRVEGSGSYCGGVAIIVARTIVARTKRKAISIANKIENSWGVTFGEAEELTTILPNSTEECEMASYFMGE